MILLLFLIKNLFKVYLIKYIIILLRDNIKTKFKKLK